MANAEPKTPPKVGMDLLNSIQAKLKNAIKKESELQVKVNELWADMASAELELDEHMRVVSDLKAQMAKATIEMANVAQEQGVQVPPQPPAPPLPHEVPKVVVGGLQEMLQMCNVDFYWGMEFPVQEMAEKIKGLISTAASSVPIQQQQQPTVGVVPTPTGVSATSGSLLAPTAGIPELFNDQPDDLDHNKAKRQKYCGVDWPPLPTPPKPPTPPPPPDAQQATLLDALSGYGKSSSSSTSIPRSAVHPYSASDQREVQQCG